MTTALNNGKYLLTSTEIGRGGFSVVRLAHNAAGNTPVAMKIIKKSDLKADDVTDLKYEVDILSSLQYRNIVRQYDFFEDDKHYYVALEYLDGGELFDRIVAKNYYTEKEARDLVLVLLTAIKYCHDRGVVHRDLKPENLLLTSKTDDADLKIADFGFASKCEGYNLTRQLGTPSYIAPEIIEHKSYGLPVDMWSFGVILYILLVGYPPFHDDNRSILFGRIRRGEYKFHVDYWSHVSEEAKDLIRGLLTVDMTKRLTVDQALAHPWLKLSPEVLAAINLENSLEELKKFQATRKLKGAVKAVMAVNKFKKLFGFKGFSSESNVDAPPAPDASSTNNNNTVLPPAPPVAPPRELTFFEKYQLGDKLGEGGFSVVKMAMNVETSQIVAVKIVDKKGLSSEDDSSLRHEVEILQLLNHEHITKVIDFYGNEPDYYYIVLEYIDGGELFDRIVAKRHYTELEARNVAFTCLATLAYCHNKSIVHRDLKPENLLLTSKKDDTDIKIADFGFAEKCNGNSLTAFCGTPGYLAPEIIKNEAYGLAIDMWSFGVILYILLGGYPPFHDDNQIKLFQKISQGRYEFHERYWRNVTDSAKDLIRGLLTVDPTKRLTVQQALEHPWLGKSAEELAAINLDDTKDGIKSFQANRKLKAHVKAVMAINKMSRLLGVRRLSSGDAMDGNNNNSNGDAAATTGDLTTETEGEK